MYFEDFIKFLCVKDLVIMLDFILLSFYMMCVEIWKIVKEVIW